MDCLVVRSLWVLPRGHQVNNSAVLRGACGAHAPLPGPQERDRAGCHLPARRLWIETRWKRLPPGSVWGGMEHARTTGPSARAALGQARGDSGRHWKFREEAPTSEMDSQGAGAGVQRKGGCYLGVEDVRCPWQQEGWKG